MSVTEKRPVLVATEADDVTADMVITELNRRSVPVVRVNPADIGAGLTVSARFGTCPAPVAGQVRTPSRTTDLDRLRAVYWRRPVWPTFQYLSDDDARFAAAQVRYGLGGALYALDGGRKDYSALSYSVVDLPEHLDKALLSYLDHFGLVSGSFDLAIDRAGNYWWLELNPNGQWGWLEEHTGLKMSAAFADLLTRGDAR
ncbi:hypothetical protein [Streptomyces coffeae]|uniref:ATP-grasp ribosomal peptide maturase n=1 Tax=Streptomyces coffeae TaxID=621382 RepID=A0ABS1NHQ3_9ACTN|nr:hypothetical protein [Streptomyces coffeae]MBL1099538.1 hypothetical protein [Streptomyces coffeae]